MTTKFIAKKVPVLRLSMEEDTEGHIIPPECFVETKADTPIFFEDKPKDRIGWAKLKRVSNKVLADMELFSEVEPPVKALDLIQGLYPGAVFVVTDSVGPVITGIRITSVLLGVHGNMDPNIEPLGDKVLCPTAKRDLH